MGSRMVDYSGRGPTLACVCKPDLVAPGSGIISCCNGPGKYFQSQAPACPRPCVRLQSPAAGEVPGHEQQDVKLRIRERALDLGLPHNQQGVGKLDVGRLLGENTSPKASGLILGKLLKKQFYKEHTVSCSSNVVG